MNNLPKNKYFIFNVLSKACLLILAVSLFSSCKKDKDAVVEPDKTHIPIVYVAGVNEDEIVLWKDGVRSYFAPNTNNNYITGLFVSGSDVYMVGYQYNFVTDNRLAILWKNGKETLLFPSEKNIVAARIFVTGNDVYILGYKLVVDGYQLFLWKNGTFTAISSENDYANEGEILYDSTNVTVSFREFFSEPIGTKYWTNGSIGPLPAKAVSVTGAEIFKTATDLYKISSVQYINSDTSRNAFILSTFKNGIEKELERSKFTRSLGSIFVYNNDIYICGYEYNSENEVSPTLWKNGVKSKLAKESENFNATAIYIQ